MSNNLDKYKEQATETESRWIAFIGKLKERTIELCEASIPELISAYKDDPDEYKRAYSSMLSGIIGQIRSITDKADNVFDENVKKVFDRLEDKVDEDADLSVFVNDAYTNCCELLSEFDDWTEEWVDKIKDTDSVDLEAEYQAILDEHEQIKEKFSCKQCGSTIPLPRLLFLITHLECPACQTQNTFTPSSKAANLEHLTRQLAEQRTKHLYNEYQKEEDKEREIYDHIHNLELSIGFDDNHPNAGIIQAQVAELEVKRKQAIENAPKLHKKYLRAMFNEWHTIMPDLREQNEKFYESLIRQSNLEDIELI